MRIARAGRRVAGPFGARLVIGADGARSGVAERVGAVPTWVGRNASASAQLARPAAGAEWSRRPVDLPAGRLVAAIPVSAVRSCVMACASPLRIGPGGPDVLLLCRGGPPQLAARLDIAETPPGWRTWPGRPGHLRPCAGPGWALGARAAARRTRSAPTGPPPRPRTPAARPCRRRPERCDARSMPLRDTAFSGTNEAARRSRSRPPRRLPSGRGGGTDLLRRLRRPWRTRPTSRPRPNTVAALRYRAGRAG